MDYSQWHNKRAQIQAIKRGLLLTVNKKAVGSLALKKMVEWLVLCTVTIAPAPALLQLYHPF